MTYKKVKNQDQPKSQEPPLFDDVPEDLSEGVDEIAVNSQPPIELATEFSIDHVDFDDGHAELVNVLVGDAIPQMPTLWRAQV